MRNLFPTLLMVALFVVIIAAVAKPKETDNDQGVLVEEEIKPFDKLVLAGVFNVEIRTGDKEAVVIDTDEQWLKYVEIKQANGKLTIKTEEAYKKSKAHNIKIYITCKKLSMLRISGVGNIKTTNELISDDLELNITGVGNIDLDIETESIMGKVSAVGDVTLNGSSDKGTFTVSGVGNFDASDFVVKDLFLTNSGVGQVQVHATEELELKSSGIGAVSYYGKPAKKNINNSGLGKVREK